MRAIGLYGCLGKADARAPAEGVPAHQYLFTVCTTIAGGTAEIHRNNIAGRGLGLQRD
jgi:hypothetical protein